MRDLFDTAKTHTGTRLDAVEELLKHPAYEPRMAAFCIMDFKARRKLKPQQRQVLCDLYINRHDRISTWDMVDRSAPRVVGGFLAGGPCVLLHELAEAEDPLRRRIAITAPLLFVRAGNREDLETGFAIAARLATDPEPVAHNAVGIFLKHAGTLDPERLHRSLLSHANSMPRVALRLATEKLETSERSRYLTGGV